MTQNPDNKSKNLEKLDNPRQTELSELEKSIRHQLDNFWTETVRKDLERLQNDPTLAKNTQIPLARIKKIMKIDENVKMISGEVPALLSKVTEYFILQLGYRSWIYTERNKRRTMQKSDIVDAVNEHDDYDFLIDVLPRQE